MAKNFNKFSSGLGIVPGSAPLDAEDGDFYYDSTDDKFKFREDGSWVEIPTVGPGSGQLIGTQIFTSSGTYNKNTSASFIIVEVVGGGGGSGGTASTSSTQQAISAGGGGGEYTRKTILNSSIASTETITIGGGGSAGSAGANNGGTGGTSSFGAHLTAIGGGGGEGGTATTSGNTNQIGGAGGTGGSGADLSIPGGYGDSSRINGGLITGFPQGGGSYLANSVGHVAIVAGNGALPQVGLVYGGGASGRVRFSDNAAGAGAAGAPGIIIVYEYS